MRQTAEQWAAEGLEKYGAGAIAWIGRWKVNLQDYPDDLTMLDRAIEILEAPSLGAAGGCQRASTTKQIQNCRIHQLACLEYLQDPTKDSELTRNYGSQDERGAIQGLEDWFAQELLLTYPEIFNK